MESSGWTGVILTDKEKILAWEQKEEETEDRNGSSGREAFQARTVRIRRTEEGKERLRCRRLARSRKSAGKRWKRESC